MFKIFLALHLLTAIFAVGPLVHAATTASRGLRKADAAATATATRTITIYSYVSTIVVIIGFGLMSMDKPNGNKAGEFTDLWIWLSVVLWIAAMALALGLVTPTLQKATAAIGRGESVSPLIGRVAAAGGIVGLIFTAIVFLMVYQPGS